VEISSNSILIGHIGFCTFLIHNLLIFRILNFDSVKIFSFSAQQFAELGLTSVLKNTTPQYG